MVFRIYPIAVAAYPYARCCPIHGAIEACGDEDRSFLLCRWMPGWDTSIVSAVSLAIELVLNSPLQLQDKVATCLGVIDNYRSNRRNIESFSDTPKKQLKKSVCKRKIAKQIRGTFWT